MVLALIFVLALVSCYSFELDNPNDPRNKSSSSGLISSGSSELPSSSSGVVSSSSYTGCTAAYNNEEQYCSNGTIKHYGSVTYEGQPYKTVEIGNQIWMAENLNYEVEEANGSNVCYDNIDSNCVKYGRLYSYETATNVCNRFGNNAWRLPKYEDWMELNGYLDGVAGKHLKATSGWNNNGNGEDTYGFAALPGGSREGQFSNVGSNGYWWSASNDYWSMSNNSDKLVQSSYNNNSLFSVRCVKDN